jgi:hypothetical protein
MSFDPIVVDMEVAESEQPFDMEVAEQIVVNPAGELYTKLAETEVTVNTTSTSVTVVENININPASDAWTSAHQIFVSIRDKAGKRNGHFLGADAIFSNANPANGSSAANAAPARNTYLYNANGEFVQNNSGYGVFAYDINSSGRIRIASRYNATSSLTIDGTYKIEVYALPYPDNVSPFA